jgi:hypothetical protein
VFILGFGKGIERLFELAVHVCINGVERFGPVQCD